MINLNNNEPIRPIHYLGSKLRLLDAIHSAVDNTPHKEGQLLDLFSGSGTVSKYMQQYMDVTAIDIQHYSKVLCDASSTPYKGTATADEIVSHIRGSQFTSSIKELFSLLIEYENKSVNEAKAGTIDSLYEIIETGSLYVYMNESVDSISCNLDRVLADTIIRLKASMMENSVDTMITRYYGGLYFSYRQSVELDCISHYVFCDADILKTKALAALLSTTSEIVNTVGKQFAQPLKVRDSNKQYKATLLNKILSDRELDTFSIFEKWLDYYIHCGTDSHSCTFICADYLDAMSLIDKENISIIYADPPYTRYHYSRYYHVLETICLRDNPSISTTFPNGKGGISRAIYRNDRHQSPFCIKSQAENAFRQLFSACSRIDAPLILSYSPFDPSKAVTPRLQTINQLVELAHNYYDVVRLISPGKFVHSKLNSSENNLEASEEAEILIICTKGE